MSLINDNKKYPYNRSIIIITVLLILTEILIILPAGHINASTVEYYRGRIICGTSGSINAAIVSNGSGVFVFYTAIGSDNTVVIKGMFIYNNGTIKNITMPEFNLKYNFNPMVYKLNNGSILLIWRGFNCTICLSNLTLIKPKVEYSIYTNSSWSKPFVVNTYNMSVNYVACACGKLFMIEGKKFINNTCTQVVETYLNGTVIKEFNISAPLVNICEVCPPLILTRGLEFCYYLINMSSGSKLNYTCVSSYLSGDILVMSNLEECGLVTKFYKVNENRLVYINESINNSSLVCIAVPFNLYHRNYIVYIGSNATIVCLLVNNATVRYGIFKCIFDGSKVWASASCKYLYILVKSTYGPEFHKTAYANLSILILPIFLPIVHLNVTYLGSCIICIKWNVSNNSFVKLNYVKLKIFDNCTLLSTMNVGTHGKLEIKEPGLVKVTVCACGIFGKYVCSKEIESITKENKTTTTTTPPPTTTQTSTTQSQVISNSTHSTSSNVGLFSTKSIYLFIAILILAVIIPALIISRRKGEKEE